MNGLILPDFWRFFVFKAEISVFLKGFKFEGSI